MISFAFSDVYPLLRTNASFFSLSHCTFFSFFLSFIQINSTSRAITSSHNSLTFDLFLYAFTVSHPSHSYANHLFSLHFSIFHVSIPIFVAVKWILQLPCHYPFMLHLPIQRLHFL